MIAYILLFLSILVLLFLYKYKPKNKIVIYYYMPSQFDVFDINNKFLFLNLVYNKKDSFISKFKELLK